MTDTVHLLVMARDPVPGKVKTRLEPFFGAQGAARLAMAGLLDTLDAARAAPVARRTLIFDSHRPDWLPARFGYLRAAADWTNASPTPSMTRTWSSARPWCSSAVTPPKSTPGISPPPSSVSTTGSTL